MDAAAKAIFLLAMILLPFQFIGDAADDIACARTAAFLGLRHKHGMLTGCLVEIEGRYERIGP